MSFDRERTGNGETWLVVLIEDCDDGQVGVFSLAPMWFRARILEGF